MELNRSPQLNGQQTPIQVIYDDNCNLCLGLLHFFQPKIGAGERVQFIAQHSERGKELLGQYRALHEVSGSMVVIKNGHYYTKSEAVVQMADGFSGSWKALRFLKWIPRRLRDWGYSVIARNRYRLFGRKTDCSCDRDEQ